MTSSERRQWITRLERELFPFQESEEEQEAFTDVGRKRVEQFLRQFEREVRKGGPVVKRKPKLPRAPLPKQTGGAHRTRKDEPWRKRKHKGRED